MNQTIQNTMIGWILCSGGFIIFLASMWLFSGRDILMFMIEM